MSISIVDWHQELSSATFDKAAGIQIATLLESEDKGTYITIIQPGASVNPHYHKEGDEEYHIISGNGVIRLLPVDNENKDFQMVCKQVNPQNSFVIPPNVIHQLSNNGEQPLILLFSCPLPHLKEDRFMVKDLEKRLNEERNYTA